MAWTDSNIEVSKWLRGLLGISISDDSINSILAGRSIDGSAALSSVSQKDAELLKADLYVWYSTSPSTGQSIEDADGGWKHKEGSYSLTPYDKNMMLKLANNIYAKYGEEAVSSGSGVKLINL